jgi:hypothetical protein
MNIPNRLFSCPAAVSRKRSGAERSGAALRQYDVAMYLSKQSSLQQSMPRRGTRLRQRAHFMPASWRSQNAIFWIEGVGM